MIIIDEEDSGIEIENVFIPVSENVCEFSEMEPESVSDFDVNGLGQDMIEWDGPYGRYWVTYENRVEYDAVLARNKVEWEEFEKTNGKPYQWVEKYIKNPTIVY